MKPIRLSKHAQGYLASRGFTHAEVKEAIRTRPWQPAELGKRECRKDFPFGGLWNGRRYATKPLAEGIAADYDAAGRLAGLEILDAIRRFGDGETLQEVLLEGIGAPVAAVREKPGKKYGK